MEYPLINIITRASRPNYFKLNYESIHSQTYGKFNHIVTYETQEMYDYLKEFDKNGRMTLVRVPNKRRIPNLKVSWNHNPQTESYLNPDHDYLDYQYDEVEDYKDIHLPVDPIIFINPITGIESSVPNETWREHAIHFPYDSYLKIAERAVKGGWIMYLDDDDVLYNNEVLDRLSKVILDHDEDTFHINTFEYPDGSQIPDLNRRQVYKVGFPFVHRQISSVSMLFHSKYMDYTYWDEWSSSDFRCAVSLREAIPKLNITDIVAVRLTSGTNGGSREDLS